MDKALPPALPPHYYRDNFICLCETVEQQYADLLLPEELDLLQRFYNLAFDAQCLYIRLVSRVGPWFRESRLEYPELGLLSSAIDELLDGAFAVMPAGLSPHELGRLFTRAELLAMFAHLPVPVRASGKDALLQQLDEQCLSTADLLIIAQQFDGARLLAPACQDWVQLLQLLFFGNRRQGMTDFVLSDLGVARYYDYELDRRNRLFASRAAIDEYLGFAYYSDAWYELCESGDPESMAGLGLELLASEIQFPTTERRWHRLCNTVAREMERRGETELALKLYRCSQRHPARERQARILEATGDYLAALALCDAILDSPWNEQEGEAASRILPRVRRKLDGSKSPRRRDNFATQVLQLPPAAERVETRVANYLSSQWQVVRYVENNLMNTLFGLAFWEQIFAPVPGAFHNAFQSVPADMYEPAFQASRRAILGERLRELGQVDLREELGAAYRRYFPCQCRWVNWRRIDCDLVEQATRIIPTAHLLAIWERMLFDPGENRRGFPDLVALGAARGDYCFIEVKGPGDALQDSQKRWLRFFEQSDIPASVAWIEWDSD